LKAATRADVIHIDFLPHLNLVAPEDILKHWGFVEAGLFEIIRRTNETWTPTHVRQALNENRAALFVGGDGFVVLQRLPEGWTSDPVLHVWAAWFPPGKAKAGRVVLTD